MRFAVVAAFFAGAVMANGGAEAEPSTVYETDVMTITSCGPTVTDCPATATSVPVHTETEGEGEWTTHAPVPTTIASGMPHPNGSHPWSSEYSHPHPWSSEPAACGGVSVKTIHTSVTTVVPTVIYETVDVPCETHAPTGPAGTGAPHTSGHASPSTGPSPTTTPVFTGGASSMGVSMVAAAAGIVALLA